MKLAFTIGLLTCLSVVKGMGEFCTDSREPCEKLMVAYNHLYQMILKGMKGELGRYTPPDGKHVYVPGQYMCAEHEANNIEVFKVREEVNVTSIFMAELATYNITVVEKYPCYFTPERGNTTQTIRRFFPDGTKLYFHEIYQKDVVWAEHAHKIGMEQAMKDYTEIEGKEISQEEFVKFLEPGRDWLLEFGLMPKAPRSKEHSELTTDQQEKATDPSQ